MSSFIQQFDRSPISSYKILENGFLRFSAPIFRVTSESEKGIKYFDSEKKPYFQKVSKKLLDSSLNTFLGLPITSDHPDAFVDSSNAAIVTKGLTGTAQSSIFVSDKFAWITGTVFDENLIQDIKLKERAEISPGYLASLQNTDQDDIKLRLDQKGNHVAFVKRGRMGSAVGLTIDSGELEPSEQFDADFDALMKSDLGNLPDRFLDFSINPDRETINLKSTEELITMKTANLIFDDQVYAIQSDRADEVSKIFSDALKELSALKVEKNDLVKQNEDSKASIETLRSEFAAKETKIQTDTQANVKEEAIKIAMGIHQILPRILAINPSYEINMDALDEVGMKKEFLMALLPEQKDSFMAMNTDPATLEGAMNIGKISMLFDCKVGELNRQDDALETKTSAKPYSSLDELKILLTNGTNSKPKDRKPDPNLEYVKNIDSNY